MIGTPRTRSATATLAVPRIDSTARVYPTNITPLVPTKIDAGWKFQRRNPSRAPARTKQSTAMNGWPTGPTAVVRLISPRVNAAISEMPVDSPSSPSMKLMLLIIPTIQTTLKATPNALPSGIWPGPNGFAIVSIVTPSATAPSATTSWPASCQRARIWRTSSRKPIAAAARPPMSRAPSSCGPTDTGMNSAGIARRSTRMTATIATVRKAAATAIPPPRGIGRRLTRLGSGRSTSPNAFENRRTPGVRTSARSAADTNATRSAGAIAPTSGMKLIRPR